VDIIRKTKILANFRGFKRKMKSKYPLLNLEVRFLQDGISMICFDDMNLLYRDMEFKIFLSKSLKEFFRDKGIDQIGITYEDDIAPEIEVIRESVLDFRVFESMSLAYEAVGTIGRSISAISDSIGIISDPKSVKIKTFTYDILSKKEGLERFDIPDVKIIVEEPKSTPLNLSHLVVSPKKKIRHGNYQFTIDPALYEDRDSKLGGALA
jgi:hypothetical protein